MSCQAVPFCIKKKIYSLHYFPVKVNTNDEADRRWLGKEILYLLGSCWTRI
jgi:hypothetical protein